MLKISLVQKNLFYDRIVLQADQSLQNTTHQERKRKAASDFDSMWGSMTLDMFMKHLKSHDPDVKKGNGVKTIIYFK